MARYLWLLLAAGCILSKPSLVRSLHEEREEVLDAESSELSYRGATPDPSDLRGAKLKDLEEELGRGDCMPRGEGRTCTWRFFAVSKGQWGGPLLHVDFDAKEKATSARWEELQ